MTGVISGSETAYPSGSLEFTTGFSKGSCCSICFLCNICRSLFVFSSFVNCNVSLSSIYGFGPLCYLQAFFVYIFAVFFVICDVLSFWLSEVWLSFHIYASYCDEKCKPYIYEMYSTSLKMKVLSTSKPHAMMSLAFSCASLFVSSMVKSFHRNFSSSVIWITSGTSNVSCNHL